MTQSDKYTKEEALAKFDEAVRELGVSVEKVTVEIKEHLDRLLKEIEHDR